MGENKLNISNMSYKDVQELVASDGYIGDDFGCSVAAYGDRVVVGMSNKDTCAGVYSGQVYVYDWDGVKYVETATIVASDGAEYDEFGMSVAIDGDRLVVGAHAADIMEFTAAGIVYVYDWNGAEYVEVFKVAANDFSSFAFFGASVALQGNKLIVGADRKDSSVGNSSGKVYAYTWDGTEYIETATLIASDISTNAYFGTAVAINGNMLLVGSSGVKTNSGVIVGKVYFYHWSGEKYVEVGTLMNDDKTVTDYFGSALALENNRLIVGSCDKDRVSDNNGSGNITVYDLFDGEYIKQGVIVLDYPNPYFAVSLALNDNRLVAGNPGNNDINGVARVLKGLYNN